MGEPFAKDAARRNRSQPDTRAEAVELLALDCDLARWALMPDFHSGQSILSDSAKTLRTLAAERDAAISNVDQWRSMWEKEHDHNAALQAKLDEAVGALKPFAQLAKHHAADAPEWGPFDSVTAQVSVMNLRAARATLTKLKGTDHE